MLESTPLAKLSCARHGFFTRQGGLSVGLYESLNCGLGSSDRPDLVAANRAHCAERLGLTPDALATAFQVHGVTVVRVETPWQPASAPRADALVTDRPGVAIGILTADCAPILLADPQARIVGAAHAGWKGAKSGVADEVVAEMEAMGAARDRIVAAVGPAIGADSYEVGEDFMMAFLRDDPAAGQFFRQAPKRKPHFDLPGYVVGRLRALGLVEVEGIAADTCADSGRFFSYRRSCLRGEPDYGRQLSAIALI